MISHKEFVLSLQDLPCSKKSSQIDYLTSSSNTTMIWNEREINKKILFVDSSCKEILKLNVIRIFMLVFPIRGKHMTCISTRIDVLAVLKKTYQTKSDCQKLVKEQVKKDSISGFNTQVVRKI